MIESPEDLRTLYPEPGPRSLRKEIDRLDPHCLRFIALSPFVVVASAGTEGRLDASPRGGPPGFVKAMDPRTLLLPDARGNNRLDTFRNVLAVGRVGLLFLVPGVDETLRVNGPAALTQEADGLRPFAQDPRPPRVVLRVTVEEAFLHCAKALMRARLWQDDARVPRSALPTMGEMLRDQTGSAEPPETQEAMLARYARDL